ncbi:MAG: hypothetical protein ACSHXF_01115 [Aquaticitalea sp.]
MSCQNTVAQVKKIEKDSSNVYEKLEVFSKKSKTTKFLHRLVFKSVKKVNSKGEKPKDVQTQSLDSFEGKIIRRVYIQSHDPFGFSFTDSTETANSWLEKTGNFIHSKSKKFAVRNFLLIKEHEPLDVLALSESQRLLRSQNFIRSVETKLKTVGLSKDSVDVYIDVLDSWSLIPTGSVSTSKYSTRLKERNFLGFGHQFEVGITDRLDDGRNAYNLRYAVSNFKNTFIGTSVGYTIDLDGNYNKYFVLDRPFYSPLTSWAGGINMNEQFRREYFLATDLEPTVQNFKFQSQDIWAGHSFKIFEGTTTKERTTNLISSIRLLNVNFKEAPSVAIDSINYFSDETSYMGSVGISSRQFIQDSYIFRDGITEDVPVGTIYAITGGVQHKNQKHRPYLGGKISHGNYFSWGYLSTNFEYGTFINKGKTEQTAYSFQANYFTNLISLGDKWKMRQFVKPQFLIGTNRQNSIGDRVTIDENNRFPGLYGTDDQRQNSGRIQGFNSGLEGTKKYVLSLQTQFYSPWEVLGFRLNPFTNITSAVIGNEGASITKSKLYSSFGVGLIVRNDFLVFSSFQLSFSYYPSIPNQGENIFDTNSFSTDDFGFQNFNLGKPTPVWYN